MVGRRRLEWRERLLERVVRRDERREDGHEEPQHGDARAHECERLP